MTISLFVVALLALAGLAPSAAAAPADRLAATLSALCRTGLDADPGTQAAGGTPVGAARDRILAGGGLMRTLELQLEDKSTVTARIFAVAGRVRRVRGELSGALPSGGEHRPLAAVDLDYRCAPVSGRLIAYRADGSASHLVLLDRDLEPTGAGEPLDPPVPAGRDPGGVLVGHVDSGVNYLLPAIGGRLARDATGRALGVDFWDLDPRPFDADTGRSPFLPMRHGTAVASVLLREAPAARLLPFRYPRPDMTRMAALVEDAAAKGVRIMMMPLGSRRRADWAGFAEAARRRPEILFVVSAGNEGRDIDREPVFPAALDLDGLLVVTSSGDEGRLAAGSNWGARSVDLMVPAERLAVTGFDGRPARASGSSYAVPRIAALAARLAARNPRWDAAALKRAIRARTRPAPQPGTVGWGWIPEPDLVR